MDTTDNICGIPGIGPAKAEKILEGISGKNLIATVYREYRKKFGIIKGTDKFAENWQLIKLRERHGEYFIQRYEAAFSLLENIKKNFIHLNP